MLRCPVKTLSEWKTLEEEYGEDYAMIAYVRNGFEIPSIQQAYEILNPDISNRIADTTFADQIDYPYQATIPMATYNEESRKVFNTKEYRKEMPLAKLDDSIAEVLSNFETYFPDFRYLDSDQRVAMVLAISNGALTINCGL